MASALSEHSRHGSGSKQRAGAGNQKRGADRPTDGRNAGERAIGWLARSGLVARSVFYALLVYLVAQLAITGSSAKQANAHGVLTTVASTPGGLAAIAATATGFLAFGVARIWGAIRDKRPSRGRRATTFVRGLFYVALTWVPLSFALGRHSTGSEQQQHRTASGLLHLPAGREILFALGLIVVGVCVHQLWTGVDQEYADGMATDRSPAWVRAAVRASGAIGIPSRAAVFLPVGIFFMVAAVQSDAQHADGIDRELASLSQHAWGTAVLGLVALGLAVFVVYSLLEARYRTVTRGK